MATTHNLNSIFFPQQNLKFLNYICITGLNPGITWRFCYLEHVHTLQMHAVPKQFLLKIDNL